MKRKGIKSINSIKGIIGRIRKLISFSDTCGSCDTRGTFSFGFTLMEFVIYMALLSILLSILVNMFTATIDVQLTSESFSSVSQDSRFILSRLSYDIQRAQTIVNPSSVSSQSSTLQLTIDGINYTYNLYNDNLQITDDQGTDVVNSVNTVVSNVNFLRVGNIGGKNAIRYTFTITSKTKREGKTEIKTTQNTVGVR